MTARARVLDYALFVAGLWLAWVLMFRWAGPEALSPPGATLQRMGEYLTSAQFWPHAVATGIAFAYACVIALAGGFLLGLALGTNRLAGQVGEPILSSLYSIPKITLGIDDSTAPIAAECQSFLDNVIARGPAKPAGS